MLKDVLDHPDLKEGNALLWAAFNNFRDLYPGIDKQTLQAVEARLCGFDVL